MSRRSKGTAPNSTPDAKTTKIQATIAATGQVVHEQKLETFFKAAAAPKPSSAKKRAAAQAGPKAAAAGKNQPVKAAAMVSKTAAKNVGAKIPSSPVASQKNTAAKSGEQASLARSNSKVADTKINEHLLELQKVQTETRSELKTYRRAMIRQVHEAETKALEAEADARLLRKEIKHQFLLGQSYRRLVLNGIRPVTLGAYFGDFAAAVKHSAKRGPRQIAQDVLNMAALRRSLLFDPDHYQRMAKIDGATDGVRHYYYNGAKAALDPSAIFSIARYLERYPDVKMSGVEPLSHFLRNGNQEGRDPLVDRVDQETVRLPEQSQKRAIEKPVSHQKVREKQDWLVARLPQTTEAELNNYEHRTDDLVPKEAELGEGFATKLRLFQAVGNFAHAARSIEGKLVESTCATGKPDVSIVIPVYGQLGYTLSALHSLSLHKSKYSFEILIGDDCSIDETEAVLRPLKGIKYIRHAENGGFIVNCNKTTEAASGKYLILLNNDTRVVDGWLDELIDSFTIFPNAGMVGSKLFYPDGSLQEAGGIVWRDGSCWNYGRNQDPNWPEFCYARRVDFVSGASIATPLSLWKKLGGFDKLYCPAYYEDSDYAFRVRQAGFETWFQPLSRVIHYEGKTSGTDLNTGVKAYQVRNATKFYERWKDVLANHGENGFNPEREKDRTVQKKVLVLDATTPTPDQDAGSITAVKVMQVLQNLNYQVTFVPADNFLYQRRYIDDLQRIGIECLVVPFTTSLRSHLIEAGESYDLVHIFRHAVMEAAVQDVRTYSPRAKVMFNNVDLHYLRVHRQGVIESNPKLVALAEASKPDEIKTMQKADFVFVPSTVEKNLLDKEQVLPKVEVMPFMVDTQKPLVRSEDPRDLLFLGGFDHSPNGDAVEWFIANVWPKLVDDKRIGRFLIVGAKPPPHILAMATDRVLVTGRIDDLEPVFTQSRAMVVPLRYGAGVKGKVYTSLAYGTPVITTSIGAEGIIGLQPGQDVLMAETADEFVKAIKSIYEQPSLFEKLCKQGPKFIDEYATLKAGERAMAAAMGYLNLPFEGKKQAKKVASSAPQKTLSKGGIKS